MGRVQVHGHISSAQFGEHRFVVGAWHVSPIGPFGDVMYRKPDGRRILIAPSEEVVAFITAIYEFDDVVVTDLHTQSDGRSTEVESPRLQITLSGGRSRPLPIARPLGVTRWLERPIARALMGVETYGTSPTGATEWYQTRGWRWVDDGSARADGRDLGGPVTFTGPMGVGFSEPPNRPSIVSVHVTIDLPR